MVISEKAKKLLREIEIVFNDDTILELSDNGDYTITNIAKQIFINY